MNFSQPVLLLLLPLTLLLTECALPQNQGKLIRDGEITKLVESATVLPNHTYYYTGPEAEPDAVIAIDNRFTLQAKYWIKADNVEKQLKDWNRFIDNAHRISNEREGDITLSIFYHGARIMNLEGTQVGIWYSRHKYTVIKFPDPNTVVLYAPFTSVKDEPPSAGF